MDLDALEKRRLDLQAAVDAAKAPGARNRMGQFATPPNLARAILTEALGRIEGGAGKIDFLDPAFGTGSFLTALLAAAPRDRLGYLHGFEADPDYGDPARTLWRDSGLDLDLADFTQAQPKRRYSLIVCNPPYVRHHHLSPADKVRLAARGERAAGVKLSRLAGLYAHFMLLSEEWARPGALAAWLVPSEFMDVNYGAAVRQYMTQRVTLLRVHRFDPADVQFGDALVSSAVLWWRHTPPPSGHAVLCTRGGLIETPRTAQTVSLDTLASSGKWTQFPSIGLASPPTGPKLGEFFHIRRGVATGDNKFFIVSPDRARSLDLPPECLRPILPGPRRLPANIAEIKADAEGNPRLERPLLLVDCPWPEPELAGRSPALARYIATGAETVAGGYLCRHRTPWYAQEKRPPPPLVCSYMGRGDRPFRFVRNRSNAVASNVWLLLYPRPGTAADDGDTLDRLWHALKELSAAALVGHGRVYGGGLHKLEPRELANLPVPPELISELNGFDCGAGE